MKEFNSISSDEERLRSIKYLKAKPSIEGLLKICEEYKLDYQNFLPESKLSIDEKIAQLLHEYRIVLSISEPGTSSPNEEISVFARKALGVESSSISVAIHEIYKHLNGPNAKIKHPAYSLEYNLMLVFLYVAGRNSGNPIFLIDIIENAANDSIPYFTGYTQYLKKNKPLSRGYTLIPTNLPTTQWLRKAFNKMLENGDFELLSFPSKKCFKKIQVELDLPQAIVNIAEHLHSKIEKRGTQLSDEALILGSIIFVIKLVYGLDDRPYVRGVDLILKDALPEEIYKKILSTAELYKKQDNSAIGNITAAMPSLYELVTVLEEKVDKKRKTIPWKLAELRKLTMEEIEKYLSYCGDIIFNEENLKEENSDQSHIYNNLAEIFDTVEIKEDYIVETLDIKLIENDKKDVSEYVLEELEFAQTASKILTKAPEKKIVFPHPSESYLKYKQISSDLSKDPLSYECQYLLIIFAKYLSEPANQLVRAVKLYEDIIIQKYR